MNSVNEFIRSRRIDETRKDEYVFSDAVSLSELG